MPRGHKAKTKAAWENIEFSPEEKKFKDDEWYVPSHDANGHSTREWIRLMPEMAGELELLVQSLGKTVGYQTKGDIIRHAIARHIVLLHLLEPTLPRTYLGAMQAQTLILSEDRHKSQTEQVFRDLFERVEHHLQAGDQGEAVRQMALVKAALDNTADTAWKRRWLQRFRRQYGVWLNPKPVVTISGPLEIAPGNPPIDTAAVAVTAHVDMDDADGAPDMEEEG